MNYNQKLSRLAPLALVVLLIVSGCKSHKKAVAVTDASAEKQKMEQEEKQRLQREEELKKKEQDERSRRDAESAAKESAPKAKLNEYFQAIAGAGNVSSANNSINEALSMFASKDAPVLIVISEEGGSKDYDRPTTILAYLNYLKDQKKNANNVSDLKTDSAGKITELELKKVN